MDPRKTLTVGIEIAQTREALFDILADLRNYGAWLPHSAVFRGTSAISEGPIRVGTTYVETSLWGTRQGKVTALSRPDRLGYHQPMTLRPRFLGVIDVRIEDSLIEAGAGVRLTRNLSLGFHGPVRYVADLVAQSFRQEIERLQARLKAYEEALPVTASSR